MTGPKVSVLLPLRDAAVHLDACLESLAAQTFRDFEVVAVDHGSVDDTAAVLESWKGRLPALRVLRQNGGSLLDALNLGLSQCRGRHIARMDGDDLCVAERLKEQTDWLNAHPQTGLLGSGVELFSGDGEDGPSEGWRAYQTWVNGLLTPEDLLRERFVECPLPHPTWMGRREVFERLGGYQDADLPEDYHFVLRCIEAGVGLAKHPQVLLRWREHAGRHSRAHPRYRRDAFFRLKARFIHRWLGRMPCVVWGAGTRGRLLIRCLQAEGAEVALCVGLDGPGERKATVAHGVPVSAPERLPRELPGPILVCVGTPGVRPAVHAFMAARGWKEGEDWCFAS